MTGFESLFLCLLFILDRCDFFIQVNWGEGQYCRVRDLIWVARSAKGEFEFKREKARICFNHSPPSFQSNYAGEELGLSIQSK